MYRMVGKYGPPAVFTEIIFGISDMEHENVGDSQ